MQTSLTTVKAGPILEVPAFPLMLASLFTEKRHAETADIVIRPGETEGQVQIFGVSMTRAIDVRCDGICSRARLALPGAALAPMRSRHPDAHLVSAYDGGGDGLPMLSVRSYSEAMTLSLTVPEGNGGPTCAQIEGILSSAIRGRSFSPGATAMDRALLGLTLNQLRGANRIGVEQRCNGVTLSASGEGWAATVLIAGMTEDGG